MNRSDFKRISDVIWEIPKRGAMRTAARIYASERMLGAIASDNAPQQAANVATLPGIAGFSLAMPDIHWGYGFPIGGVAAFDADEGVVSPGGVGYDINCGVRLMVGGLTRGQIEPELKQLTEALFQAVPSGVGAAGGHRAHRDELRLMATRGAAWAVDRGCGTTSDLTHIEENGCMAEADPDAVSERAWQRGADQIGTLGSGNHFIEIGYVSDVFDAQAAACFGLARDAVTVAIHCGSRGFGHQVCDDYLARIGAAAARHGIEPIDRQLACAPLASAEGRAYLGAMACAANYAFANRQMIAHRVRETFRRTLGSGSDNTALRTVYEVAHNIAKLETHAIDGRQRRVCVHRKGATRAFGPGHPAVPDDYRAAGQPVLIPGDMGRCSYVLAGTAQAMRETFGSTCHGAGRRMSRNQAVKAARGRDIFRELAEHGIVLQVKSRRTAAEEMPDAYKDVSEVVDVCERAGISRKVARIRPLGCVKG